jgi:hypothetical protein
MIDRYDKSKKKMNAGGVQEYNGGCAEYKTSEIGLKRNRGRWAQVTDLGRLIKIGQPKLNC